MQGSDHKNGISPDSLSAMLKMASKKLGISPEQLKSTLNDPKKANALLDSLDKKNNGALKSAMSDPKTLQKMVENNPAARKLFNELMGEKDNGKR